MRFLRENFQYPKESDPSVRSSAVNVLSLFSSSEALEALRDATEDPSDDVRRTVISRLPGPYGSRAIIVLALLLRDEDLSNRVYAIRILSSLHTAEVAQPLLDVLEQGVDTLTEDRFAFEAIRGRGFFTEGITDERLLLAEAAIGVGWSGNPSAAEPLHALLDDLDAQVQPAVLHALGRLGYERLAQCARPRLQAPEFPVRLAAAEALARTGDPMGRGVLCQALSSQEVKERLAALELLAGLHPKDEVDLRLLIIRSYRVMYFMDPLDEVDEVRLGEIEEESGLSPEAARQGFEKLTQWIPLKLSWRK